MYDKKHFITLQAQIRDGDKLITKLQKQIKETWDWLAELHSINTYDLEEIHKHSDFQTMVKQKHNLGSVYHSKYVTSESLSEWSKRKPTFDNLPKTILKKE